MPVLNAEVTQLRFNTETLEWDVNLHIRGCNSLLKITAQEASSVIHAFRQEDSNRMEIESDKSKPIIYYIPVPTTK